MKNLSAAISYTKKKKDHQVTKLEQSFYFDSIEALNSFLESKDLIVRVCLSFDDLSTWYMWQFNHKFVFQEEVDFNLLAQCSVLSLESNNVSYILYQKKLLLLILLFSSQILSNTVRNCLSSVGMTRRNPICNCS